MKITRKKIIVVDDSPTNLTICKNVLKPYHEVYPVSSATKMFMLTDKIKPDLILMDVEMPEFNGYETVRMLKNSNDLKDVPIIFLTAKSDTSSEMEGLDLGAVDYITKPFVGELLLRRIETHISLIEHKKELEKLNATMHKIIMSKTEQIWKLQNAILHIIAELVECRDEVTGMHISRTQKYLSCLIDKLIEQDLYTDEISTWDLDYTLPSAQLHDLGKIGIKDAILNKPGKLNEEEYETIKLHVNIGVNAINRMEQLVTLDNKFLHHAKIFAGMHHEKWDGKGYPCGLKEYDIPLEGRLMAIADVYDALISARPYKKALTIPEVNTIIKEGRGTQFDPHLVDIFIMVSDQFAEISKEGAAVDSQ